MRSSALPPLLLLAAALPVARLAAAPPPKKAAPAIRGKPMSRTAPKPAGRPAPARPAPAAPAAPATEPEVLVLHGPLDLRMLQRERRAELSHGPLADGDSGSVFDGNRHTAARARPGSPMFWQITLDRPRSVSAIEVTFLGSAPARWSVAAADSTADLVSRAGSYRLLVPPRLTDPDRIDQATFASPRAYRVYRLESTGEDGEAPALSEWALWSPQPLARLEVDAFSTVAARGESLQLRATAWFEAGARQNATLDVTWDVSPPSLGRVDSTGRFEAREVGRARVTARQAGIVSPPLELDLLPEGLPDWDVTHIELQPRLDLSDPEAVYTPGQSVTWFAHVRNYGTGAGGPIAAEWRVDGRTAARGRLPKLERFGRTEVALTTRWDGLPHEVELVVDPDGEGPEVCEGNNALAVRSDALAVSFWVEDTVLRAFHERQRRIDPDSNSWEDWAQRQVAFWNRISRSGGEGLPASCRGRWWRLDRIVVVGDGMLPLGAGAPGDPDPRDRSANLSIGIRAADLLRDNRFLASTARSEENPAFLDRSLLAELGRARLPEVRTRAGGAESAP